jgi:hypothetical protein
VPAYRAALEVLCKNQKAFISFVMTKRYLCTNTHLVFVASSVSENFSIAERWEFEGLVLKRGVGKQGSEKG